MSRNLIETFYRDEKKIYDRAMFEVNTYLDSDQKRAFNDHFEVLRASYNMEYDLDNTFDIPVIFPVVKRLQLLREAVFNRAYNGNPLYTVKSSSRTSFEQAKIIQQLLEDSLIQQNFRSEAFRTTKRFASAYGTGILYTQFHNETIRGDVPVITPDGFLTFQEGIVSQQVYAKNVPIHPRNYFQSPSHNRVNNTPYAGHFKRMTIGEFMNEVKQNRDLYIQKNLNHVLKKIKSTTLDGDHYYDVSQQSFLNNDDHTERSNNEVARDEPNVNVICMYTTLPFKGNEDSNTTYYLEIVCDKIIKFWKNPNLYNTKPYSVYTCYERDDTWYGNTDAAFSVLHEQLMKTMLSLKASNALRAMDPTLIVRKGVIDIADWQRRKHNMGMVEAKNIPNDMRLQDVIHQYTPQDYTLNATQSIIENIMASQKLLEGNPNFQAGTVNNDVKYMTATGVNAIEQQGDVFEHNILDCFNVGLMNTGQHMINALQKYLPDVFDIEGGETVDKREIQGNYKVSIDTSMYTNMESQAQKLYNHLVGLANLQGTQDPALQGLNKLPLYREWLKATHNGGLDVDKILPEQEIPQMAQPNMPGVPAPTADQIAQIGGV